MSHKVKQLFQFASLAVMTQGVLLLNQVVMLPIQIRVWKTDLTAYWLSVLAIGAVATIADFGLRSAGHAPLIRWTNDPDDLEAKAEFTELWAWIRILMLGSVSALIVGDYLFDHFYLGLDYPLWRTILLIGIGLEVLLCVRVTYFDTMGFYTEAEAGYFLLVAGRLVLSVGVLIIFAAPPSVLAWIWFTTAILSLFQQSFLSRRAGKLRLFEPIPPKLAWRHVAMIRYTMADPSSSWVRIQFPVLVLTVIAPPIATVIYVALRAIFGAARTTILQLSRYASVEYLGLRQARRFEMAEKHLTMMMLVSAFFASAVAAFVIADNGRLASLILHKMDLPVYQMMATTFGLGNAFFAFQICMAVCRRSGEVAEVAHRQYFYIGCAALFAGIALVTKSLLVWLVLMLLDDVLLALSFMLTPAAHSILRQTSSGWRTSTAAATSSLLFFVVGVTLYFQSFDFLTGRSIFDVLCTIAFFLAWILLIGTVDLSLAYGMRTARRT